MVESGGEGKSRNGKGVRGYTKVPTWTGGTVGSIGGRGERGCMKLFDTLSVLVKGGGDGRRPYCMGDWPPKE